MTSFVVDYSTNEDFANNDTMSIYGKTSLFLSDRSMDNGTAIYVFQTDITGLQVARCMVCPLSSMVDNGRRANGFIHFDG